jgi:hypothetical protein
VTLSLEALARTMTSAQWNALGDELARRADFYQAKKTLLRHVRALGRFERVYHYPSRSRDHLVRTVCDVRVENLGVDVYPGWVTRVDYSRGYLHVMPLWWLPFYTLWERRWRYAWVLVLRPARALGAFEAQPGCYPSWRDFRIPWRIKHAVWCFLHDRDWGVW